MPDDYNNHNDDDSRPQSNPYENVVQDSFSYQNQYNYQQNQYNYQQNQYERPIENNLNYPTQYNFNLTADEIQERARIRFVRNLTVAGFILSLIGIFTCGVCSFISVVGLILSSVAISKGNKDFFSITGLILGIIGTIFFIILLCFIFYS